MSSAWAAATQGPSAPDLFDEFGIRQSAAKTLPPKVLNSKHRAVNAHPESLQSARLTLNLFNDVVVTAVRDRTVDNVNGGTSWIGHVDGMQESEVFLSAHGHSLTGIVRMGGENYEIASTADNLHHITQVDPGKNPSPRGDARKPEAAPITAAATTTTGTSTSTTTTSTATTASTGTVIDLLVVYTPNALSNAGSLSGMQSKINNAVAMANQAYINSQIPMQLNLVSTAQTQYTETGDINTALTRLAATGDGYMDDVPALRDKLNADQVVLIDTDSNLCGTSYIMTASYLGSAFAPYAYSVTHDDSVYACLFNNTMAHELGHGQGNQHDSQDANTAGAYAYSYGYRLCQTGGFVDIMSYYCAGLSRISYFSNPLVLLSNLQPTGTATANTAQSMINTKDIVAAFRSSAVALPNPPSNLKAAALSSSQISLAWLDNSNNETGFSLERSLDGANWSPFATVGSNIASYADSGLNAATTYYYRVRAYNSSGNSAYSNISSTPTLSAASLVADTQAPSVAIANPKAGATVSGTVSISASASDNVKVSSLQLFIDGKSVSYTNASALSFSWNTKRISSGTHTIKAQATDPTGNIGAQSITVSH